MKNFWAPLYFCAFSLLQMDSYPLGARLLREFGARPSNFLLAICLLAILCAFFLRAIKFSLPSLVIFFATTGVISLNFFTIDFGLEDFYSRRPPFESFLAQSAVLVWALLSYHIWLFLLKNTPLISKDNAVIFSTYSTIFFVAFDLFLVTSENYALGRYTLGLLQFYHDPFRVSGATSEPSILGAWIAFLWPMLFLVRKKHFFCQRVTLVTALIILGLFFGGRTFLMLFGLQTLYLIIRSLFFGNLAKRISLALMLAPLLAIFLSFTFNYILDIENNLSSMARFGSTVTALIVGIDNFPSGIGIGQFSYYFANSVPDLFRASEEINYWASGDSESRLSTFNLPARLFVELGLVGVFYITLFFLSSVRQWIFLSRLAEDPTKTCVPLVFIAGCGFWLSQDQYGYQPAIFSISLISWEIHSIRNKRERCSNEKITAYSDPTN